MDLFQVIVGVPLIRDFLKIIESMDGVWNRVKLKSRPLGIQS